METKENRGIIHKKAFEDQYMALVSVTFCQFMFAGLSLFSLSLSVLVTQSFCGALQIGERKGKSSKGKEYRYINKL